jgi:hypothetical protein
MDGRNLTDLGTLYKSTKIRYTDGTIPTDRRRCHLENRQRHTQSRSKFRYGGTIYPHRVGGKKSPPKPTSRSDHPVTEIVPEAERRAAKPRPRPERGPVYDAFVLGLRANIAEPVLCMYVDREVRYATFVFDLSGESSKEYYGLAPDFKVRVHANGQGWSPKLAQTHASPILCFVHKRSFFLRTELPDGLLKALEEMDAGKDVEIAVTLTHPAWRSPCGRVVTRVSPPRVH